MNVSYYSGAYMKIKNCNKITDCKNPRKTLYDIDGFNINACIQCNHLYCPDPVKDLNHIRNVYSDDYFFGGNAGYSDYLKEQDILINRGRKYAKIINKHINPGSVLDVGAACGFLLKGFEQEGWSVTGIDPNESMVKFGREQLNLNLINTPLEEFETDKQFDLITMIQVVSHLWDIDRCLQAANRHLNDKGLLLIETWDMNSWPAKIFGKKWHQYSPPSVIHWFSRKSLTTILDQYKFKPIKFGRPRKKIAAHHAFSLLDYQFSNYILKSIITHLKKSRLSKLNLLYPFPDIFWALFRKEEMQEISG